MPDLHNQHISCAKALNAGKLDYLKPVSDFTHLTNPAWLLSTVF